MRPASSLGTRSGLDSGDISVRVAKFDGRPALIVLVPCAAFSVDVSLTNNTVTPAPETLKTVLADCHFPWDESQARLARSLKEPLQFAWRQDSIVLHNDDWGSTLFSTPYSG
jgi:hypothetical protein